MTGMARLRRLAPRGTDCVGNVGFQTTQRAGSGILGNVLWHELEDAGAGRAR